MTAFSTQTGMINGEDDGCGFPDCLSLRNKKAPHPGSGYGALKFRLCGKTRVDYFQVRCKISAPRPWDIKDL